MSFIIEPKIWALFPELRLVAVVASNIDNSRPNPQILSYLRETEQNTKKVWDYPNAQAHPNIAAWRKVFTERLHISGKDFPSSVESLSRRVLSGRELPDINPLVNFYNAVSLQHVVPVGGWDAAELYGGEIHLRVTRASEAFLELGQWNPTFVEEGEVSYSDADEIITRHFVWRQSESAKVTPKTTSVFLVSEILPEIGPATADQVAKSLIEGLDQFFSVQDPRWAVLDSTCRRWEWD